MNLSFSLQILTSKNEKELFCSTSKVNFILECVDEEKHDDLLLKEEKGKRHYVLMKDFNTFMYNHTLHRRKKHFCHYCLQAFSREEILKYIKDCFKINTKQRIIMPKKDEFVKFKNYEKK